MPGGWWCCCESGCEIDYEDWDRNRSQYGWTAPRGLWTIDDDPCQEYDGDKALYDLRPDPNDPDGWGLYLTKATSSKPSQSASLHTNNEELGAIYQLWLYVTSDTGDALIA